MHRFIRSAAFAVVLVVPGLAGADYRPMR